ncbi:MAG TPA: F0F1 ATP synthase subunit epsilon [Puia sp.]|nr:F0F1 ATP synthase subunit epsilon [Puia sp.]
MMVTTMHLSVHLPFRIFREEADIVRIVAEGPSGLYGIWPNRLDCVLPLVPGIFSFTGTDGKERFLAVDEGFLIKTGPEVKLSVRNAIDGGDLGQLRERVEKEFRRQKEEEQQMRSVIYRLESDFIRQFLKMRHNG